MNQFDRSIADVQPPPAASATSPFHSPPPDAGPTLRDIIAAVWRGRWPLAVWVIACVAAAAWQAAGTPPEYAATAQILLESREPQPPGLVGTGSWATPLDNAQAESQAHVIGSERVLRYVFDALNLAEAPENAPAPAGLKERAVAAWHRFSGGGEPTTDPVAKARAGKLEAFTRFSSQVSVRRNGQSYVLEVTFRARSPEAAARTANAIATAYLRDQVSVRAADTQRGNEYLQGRVALIKAEQDAADAAIRAGTIPAAALPDADARIIGAALVPLAPSAPRKGLMLALGAAVGLMSGAGVLLLRHALDRTLRTPAQISNLLQVDCLGTVPRRRRPALDLVETEPISAFATSMRAVRASLLTRLPRTRPAAIGLAACEGGVGVTTVTANLAHMLAAAGRPVALLDADLQNPTLSRALPAADSDTVAGLLTERAVPASIRLRPVTPTLGLLPSAGASRPHHPNLFLGSAKMGAVLTTLRQNATVLVDFPALSRSSDAQAVGPLLDGIVLVAEKGRTVSDDLAAAIRSLTATGTTVLGVILTRATPR